MALHDARILITGYRGQNEGMKWAATALACVANFLDLFQSSMVNFAVPAIMRDMGLSVFDVNWVIISYTVAFAAVLLFAGSTVDKFGLRLGFLTGSAFLVGANALCAWTPDKYGLFVGRAIAGVGAGFTGVCGLPIVSHLFPEGKKRNLGLALVLMSGPLGLVLGIVLGAIITSSPLRWPGLFWISLILCAVVFSFGIILIPTFGPDADAAPAVYDVWGQCMFLGGLPLLTYALDDGPNRGWTDPAILVTLVVGAAALAAIPVYEVRYAEHPAIPRHFFTNKNMALMLMTFFIFGGGFSAWFYLVTQAFSNSLGLSEITSALYLLPSAFGSILSAFLGNALMNVVSEKVQVVGAYAWLAAFLVPWGLLRQDVPRAWPIVFAVCYLFGNAPGVVRAQAAVLSTIPKAQHGKASAMLSVAYQAGGTILLALVNVVMKQSSGGDATPEALLRGYKAAFWLLAGFTGGAGLLFLVFHDRRCTLKADEVSTSSGELLPVEEEESNARSSAEKGS